MFLLTVMAVSFELVQKKTDMKEQKTVGLKSLATLFDHLLHVLFRFCSFWSEVCFPLIEIEHALNCNVPSACRQKICRYAIFCELKKLQSPPPTLPPAGSEHSVAFTVD